MPQRRRLPERRLATTVTLALLAVMAPSAASQVALPESGATTGPLSIQVAGDLRLSAPIVTQATDGLAPDITLVVAGRLILAEGAFVRAGDGLPGARDDGLGPRTGGNGGPGGNVLLQATVIVFEGGVVQAGSGGAGGDAASLGEPNAWAQGGQGGRGGVVELVGLIHGVPSIVHGSGGPGGNAWAQGAPCESKRGADQSVSRGPSMQGDGQSAEAQGEAGGCGTPDTPGGQGGNASAQGGNGGISLQGAGGNGGGANATAGPGGPGASLCPPTLEEARALQGQRAGDGGRGGDAIAAGGHGGLGATGGAGGFAIAQSAGGPGGNGLQVPGGSSLQGDDEGFSLPPGFGGEPGNVSSTGGDGSPGLNGGNGGGAVSQQMPGLIGQPCFLPASAVDVPGTSIGLLAVLLVAATASRRRARKD